MSTKGFRNSAWAEFSSRSLVTEAPSDLSKLKQGDTLWVLTLQNTWREMVLEAVKKECHVVVMSTLPNAREMETAINSGASGYCPAITDKDTLHAIKMAVTKDSIWIPAKFLRQLTGSVTELMNGENRNSDCAGLGLSEREADVVQLILKGYSNAEIAAALFVAERTVKDHLTNIFKKLNVKDRLQLALLVLKR
ncbi:response regulator transcription factor [Aliidiomarina quisquiliarum]|uniref:response regulator transcription factor n=1 Tax=Aliidiomarina quisquiliarum TaxID=2938947 RepID=UPI00208F9C5E|nr:response regulator transcription factor [Aliidiomarina quisquiliarum]